MKFIIQSIPDVFLIEPTLNYDSRGYFAEMFRQDLFKKNIGYDVNFIQDNESHSPKGTLRGLHYQLKPYAQAKLVKVVKGCVLDVVVDIRKSSKTFGQHVAVELSSKNKKQLFVPRGFAHGFVVLSEEATFCYKVDNYYAPKYERGIAFNDKNLEIDWQLSHEILKLSPRDKSLPTLNNINKLFD